MNRRNLLLVGAYIVVAGIGALQSITAHMKHPLLGAMVFTVLLLLAVTLLFFCPQTKPIYRTLSTLWPWLLVLAAMAVVDVHHYARTITSPDPLTTGLALAEPGHALLHGHDPYAVTLPRGAPISPGPGWIMLMLPFSAGDGLGVLNALALAILAVLIWQRSRVGAVVLILMCLAEPMFISEASHGQDLFAISLTFAILCIVLANTRLNAGNMFLLGLLSGFVSTSRVPMILFFGVIAFGLWQRNRRAAGIFSATTLLTCIGLHACFAIWSLRNGHPYSPLHVFGRATSHGGSLGPALIAAILLAVAAIWIVRKVDVTPETWLFGCWLSMTMLFAPIGIKELIASHFNWGWEGNNYITFPLPLLVAVIALRTGSHSPPPSRRNPAADEQEPMLQPASYS